MSKIGFDKTADRMGKALERATARVDRIVGTKPDEDLVFYENLQPADFDTLKQQYGEPSVADYIKEMETRRLKQ